MKQKFLKTFKQLPNKLFGWILFTKKACFNERTQFAIIRFFRSVRYSYLNLLYKLHLKFRKGHDVAYMKYGWYKAYSDSAVSTYIRRSTYTAFVVSFLVFTTLQYVLPNVFNPLAPGKALASSTEVEWTSQSHFQNNGATGGNYTGATTFDPTKIDITADGSVTTKYDLGTLSGLTTGSTPMGIGVNPNNNKIYVANWNSSSVTVINGNNYTVITTLSVGLYPQAIAVNTVTNKIYVSSSTSIAVINGSNDTISTTIPIAGQLHGLSVNNLTNKIYATNENTNAVNIIDGSTDTVSGNISLNPGDRATDVAVNASTNKIYIVCEGLTPDVVKVASAITNSVVTTIPITGSSLKTIRVNQNTNKAYIADNSGFVRVLDGNSDTLATSISTGIVRGLDINADPAVNKIYASKGTESSVVIIDGNTNNVLSSIATEGTHSIYSVAVNETNERVYVTNGNTNTIQGIYNIYLNGSIEDLKLYAGTGKKVSWNSITWNSTVLPSNTSIKFQARTSDDDSTWSDPSWASVGSTQTSGTTGSFDLSGAGLSASKYLEIKVSLATSDGENFPTLTDFRVTYNNLDAPSNCGGPRKLDGTDLIGFDNSNWTNETSIIPAFCVPNMVGIPTTGETLIPEVELRANDSDFTGSPSLPAGVNYSPTSVSYTGPMARTNFGIISGLTNHTTYYLQLRFTDQAGRIGPWMPGTFFDVDQTPPILTFVTVSSGLYANNKIVDLTLTGGSDANSGLGQMRFSNDGFAWSPWEAYASTKTNWDLTQFPTNINDGARTVYAQVKDNAGNVVGDQSSQADWDNGTRGTDIAKSTGSVYLLKSIGMAANSNSECASGLASGGVCVNNPWIGGRATSVLSGKSVYNRDINSTDTYTNGSSIDSNFVKWKTSLTACAGPQCTVAGPVAETYSGYVGKNVLVADNSIDFTLSTNPPTYPARDACKALGGRLPTLAELFEIYNNKASYGNNFQSSNYWAGTEYSTASALGVYFPNGSIGVIDKSWGSVYGRCVSDTDSSNLGGVGTAGIFLSPVKDLGSGLGFDSMTWNTSVSPSTITMRFRGGNSSNTSDGTWTNWQTVTRGQIDAAARGKRFIQYEATFSFDTGTNTPILSSVTVNASTSTAVTLATVPPDPPSTNLIVNPALTKNTTVSVSWDATTDLSGIREYHLYRKKDSGAYAQIATITNPTTTYNDTYFSSADATYQGLYYYRVTAVDNAGGESAQSADFPVVVCDWTGPDTPNPVTVAPDDWTADNNFSFTITASDPQISGQNAGQISKLHYRIDTPPDQNDPGAEIDISDGNPATYVLNNIQAPSIGIKTFYVVAEDSLGNINWSNVASVQFKYDPTGPAAPTQFRAPIAEATTSSITLRWNAASDPAGIAQYQILRKLGTDDWGANDTSILVNAPATSIVDSNNLSGGYRYSYKIRAKDNTGNWGLYSAEIDGYTIDTRQPDAVSGVTANACDGTSYCSNDQNSLHKGFEIKLTWLTSNDTGTGVTKYRIYRSTDNSTDSVTWDQHWSLIGVLDASGAPDLEWFDNDTNNTATMMEKTLPSSQLNDATTYYYRVTAVDGADLESERLPVAFINGNWAYDQTPDVTAPTVPASVTANALGLDSSNTNQAVEITWGQSIDRKARSQDVVPGNVSYKLYRSTDSNGPWDNNHLVTTTQSLSLTEEGLAQLTNYYYRVLAYDVAGNISDFSDQTENSNTTTYSSAVPSTPNNVTVLSRKGNPNSDPNVGHKITVNFIGSYSDTAEIVKYEVYRSLSNNSGGCNQGETINNCWIRVNNATKLNDINISSVQDDRSARSFDDTGLNDVTTYFYRIRAQDNYTVPNHPEQSNLLSGLSTIGVSSTAGWDLTPDATKPIIPVLGLDVKVKDTHPNEFELRNIITWKMLENEELPRRNKQSYESCTSLRDSQNNLITINGYEQCSDFEKYEVHREKIDPGDGHIISDLVVAEKTNLGDNYFIDQIDITFENDKFKYYIVIVDDADPGFRYQNGSSVNPATPPDSNSNISEKEYWNDSIIPSQTTPHLVGSVNLATPVGVSTAEISWVTDQDADSLVQFKAKNTSDPFVAIGQVERTPTHTVKLFGLKPQTEYEYRIVSRNRFDNNVEYDLESLPVLITSSFSITKGAVTSTTSTTEINWSTNHNASSAFVEYQLQRQPGDDPQSGTAGVSIEDLANSAKNHKVTIKGLRSNRTYTYKIKSISTDGFVAETEFLTLKTKAYDNDQFTIAPNSSNVAERNITSTTAQIVWETSIPTTSHVDFATQHIGPNVPIIAAGNNDLVTRHVVVLEGLTPGTKYYYKVWGDDANEQRYTSEESSFTAVLKPKIERMQIKNVTPYSVTISWDTNVDTETIVNWGKTSAYGEKRGTPGFSKVHELTIKDLEDNSEYHFQILAHDEAGNEVADSDKIVATPLDTAGPQILGVKTDILPIGADEAAATIIVSWQTDKPATTLVQYDEGILGGRYSKQSTEDRSLNNSHTVIIRDLKPATSYHFKIVSKDRRGNSGQSPDHTFVTPSKSKSILELILKSLEETFAWTKNLNQFFGNVGKRISGKR